MFDIYVALWKRVGALGGCVHYFDHPRAEPPSLVADQSGASGWFISNAEIVDSQPVIQIYRLECDDDSFSPSRTRGASGASLPAPDLEAELITMAHEYGHLMSFLGRTVRSEWDLYTAAAQHRGDVADGAIEEMKGLSGDEQDAQLRSALLRALSDDERERIVREEALAWEIGREVLLELGLNDFRRFDEREKHGLHAHRYRLGIEEAWPGDEAGLQSE